MLLQQIADYAIREQSSKLPAEVIHHAKRAVIDWYASLLPGSQRGARDPAGTGARRRPRPRRRAAGAPGAAPRCAQRR